MQLQLENIVWYVLTSVKKWENSENIKMSQQNRIFSIIFFFFHKIKEKLLR